MDTKKGFIVLVLGMTLLIFALLCTFIPSLQGVWESKEKVILYVKEVSISPFVEYKILLTFNFTQPGNIKDLTVDGIIESRVMKPFTFEIADGKVYFKDVTPRVRRYFWFSIDPRELESGVWLKIISQEDNVIHIVVLASWNEKVYSYIFGETVVRWFMGFVGLILIIFSLVKYFIKTWEIRIKL